MQARPAPGMDNEKVPEGGLRGGAALFGCCPSLLFARNGNGLVACQLFGAPID